MKDELVYVEHVLACIGRIDTYTEGKRSVFFGSTLVQDAVVRNLEVMAESTQRLSDDIKSRHPERWISAGSPDFAMCWLTVI